MIAYVLWLSVAIGHGRVVQIKVEQPYTLGTCHVAGKNRVDQFHGRYRVVAYECVKAAD